MNSVAELAAHPQLRLVEVETPGGTARLPASPVRLAGEPAPRAGRVPGLGQHSERLRREFAGEGRP
jgi:itaconate CoA-transferase